MPSCHQPEITVANGDWGGTSLRAVRAVLQPAAEVLCDAFGRSPDAPVRVHPGHGAPMVAWDRRPYWVRLSARDTYWSQYVFQFSHELCHILVNFDRVRGHRHKWFEESLCELASLFVLHRLVRRFRRFPPPDVLDARGYAPHFGTYAAERVARVRLPPPGQLPSWLAEHLPRLEDNAEDRSLNLVVATAMLDSFLADDSLWRDCGALNLWDAASDASFPAHLRSWADHLSAMGRTPRTPTLVRSLLLADARA